METTKRQRRHIWRRLALYMTDEERLALKARLQKEIRDFDREYENLLEHCSPEVVQNCVAYTNEKREMWDAITFNGDPTPQQKNFAKSLDWLFAKM